MDDPTSMNRYRIESVAIADNLGAIVVRYEEPNSAGGAILSERKEQEISLHEEPEMRQALWELVDGLCDIIDAAHASRRLAR